MYIWKGWLKDNSEIEGFQQDMIIVQDSLYCGY